MEFLDISKMEGDRVKRKCLLEAEEASDSLVRPFPYNIHTYVSLNLSCEERITFQSKLTFGAQREQFPVNNFSSSVLDKGVALLDPLRDSRQVNESWT